MNLMEMKKNEDNDLINFIIKNLAREGEFSAIIHIGEEKIPATLFFGDRKGSAVFLQFERVDLRHLLDQSFEISLVFKEDLYIFSTRLISKTDYPANSYEIERPSITYTSKQRMVSRHKIGNDQNMTVFYNNEKYVLLDISTNGCSFKVDKIVFKVGQKIFNLQINLSGSSGISVDAIVQYSKPLNSSEYIYGIKFTDLDWSAYQKLFNLVFFNVYPDIKPLSNFPVQEVYNLYNESGYFSLKPEENIEDNFNTLMSHWNSLNNSPQIFNSIAFNLNQKPISSATLLRIYNRTFIGESLASLPEARRDWKTKIITYLSLVDILLNHPHFSHYVSYFDANLNWHRGMFTDFEVKINNRSIYLCDKLLDYEGCDIQALIRDNPPSSNYYCSHDVDIQEFVSFYRQKFGNLRADCYSYNTEDFYLISLKLAYEVLGLQFNRKLFKITFNGSLAAYAVCEVYTNGLNLFNLLDMCRIYFINDMFSGEEVLSSLMPYLSSFYSKYRKTKFNLMVQTENNYSRVIINENLPQPIEAGRVIMSKDGMREYRKMITLNFNRTRTTGELP